MRNPFRNDLMRRVFDLCATQFAEGRMRRPGTASHETYFWRGYDGVPWTRGKDLLAYAAWRAGEVCAKERG